MKIAMIGQKNISSRSGGVEVVVQRLSEELAKKGYTVNVYNRKNKCRPKINTKEIHGINIREVPTLNKKGLAAVTSSFFATIAALKDHNNIIHYHAEGPAAMAWIPKLFGKKVIVTIHGLDHRRDKWGFFAKKYIEFGEKVAVKYADQIIVLNQTLESYFRIAYHRKTVLIPNGIDKVTLRSPNLIKKIGLAKDTYILFLGRIVPEKGIETLIKAFKLVNTDKKLIIAGASSDTDEFVLKLKNLSKGDNRIEFVGFVQGDFLRELYTNAYVYILPSTIEGMPMGLLEAMSYGNCCLVSDIPENLDVISNAGVTFKCGQVEDLVQKLQKLVDDPALIQINRLKAKNAITKKFSWDKVTNKTIKVYEGKDEL